MSKDKYGLYLDSWFYGRKVEDTKNGDPKKIGYIRGGYLENPDGHLILKFIIAFEDGSISVRKYDQIRILKREPEDG